MRRALCAWAAAAAISGLGCAGDGAAGMLADAQVSPGRAGAGGSEPDAGAIRDAAVALDAGPRHDADAGTPDGAAVPLPDLLGADFVRFDSLAPDERGVVRFAFDVPVDAASFVVTVQALTGARSIELLEVAGPDGLLWSALHDGAFAFEPSLRENVNEFVPYVLSVPSSPESPALAPGPHELLVRAGGSADRALAADVVFKRGSGEPAAGSLDVVLWFVEGAGIDAGAARENVRLQNALVRFGDIYAASGVEVAVAEYRDLAIGASAELAVLEGDAELADLLVRLAAESVASDRAVHVVFVARIDAGPGKTVLGKATGLPAPPSHPELMRRGAVVLGYETLPSAASRIGEMLAHETGHLMGLRHTSEFDGLRHDSIADTPECPAERASQASSDGTLVLSAEDCADLDGRNLLFYTPPQLGGPQDELSAGQSFVLLHSPAVR